MLSACKTQAQPLLIVLLWLQPTAFSFFQSLGGQHEYWTYIQQVSRNIPPMSADVAPIA